MRMPWHYAGKHNDNIFTKYFYKNDDKSIKITSLIDDDVDYSSMGGFDMGVDVDSFGIGDLNVCNSSMGGYSLGVNVSDPSLSDYGVCVVMLMIMVWLLLWVMMWIVMLEVI